MCLRGIAIEWSGFCVQVPAMETKLHSAGAHAAFSSKIQNELESGKLSLCFSHPSVMDAGSPSQDLLEQAGRRSPHVHSVGDTLLPPFRRANVGLVPVRPLRFLSEISWIKLNAGHSARA